MKPEDKHAVHISGDQEVHIIPIEEKEDHGTNDKCEPSSSTIK